MAQVGFGKGAKQLVSSVVCRGFPAISTCLSLKYKKCIE